jgi:hypothetical protein
MAKPMNPKEAKTKAKKKPGDLQHPNPPKKTGTDNPERNPRDQKGHGGSKMATVLRRRTASAAATPIAAAPWLIQVSPSGHSIPVSNAQTRGL